MKNIIIGISASMTWEENAGFFNGYERMYVANNYIKAISTAGANPIILPIIENDEQIEEQIKLVDGLLISGGFDIDPIFYNEEPLEKLQAIYPKRDIYELKLIKYALKYKKTILGICRGFQIINVAFGGSLYQDLTYKDGTFIKHVQNAQPHTPTHLIDIDKSSVLFEIANFSTEVRVNSFHHLALKDIGKDLKIVATAKDGVAEAIEYEKDGVFILGVQFHPEMMFSTNDFANNIFKKFIEICAKKK